MITLGISSTSEIFQLTTEEFLDKEDNIIFYFDNVLIFHMKGIWTIFERPQSVGLRLKINLN